MAPHGASERPIAHFSLLLGPVTRSSTCSRTMAAAAKLMEASTDLVLRFLINSMVSHAEQTFTDRKPSPLSPSCLVKPGCFFFFFFKRKLK